MQEVRSWIPKAEAALLSLFSLLFWNSSFHNQSVHEKNTMSESLMYLSMDYCRGWYQEIFTTIFPIFRPWIRRLFYIQLGTFPVTKAKSQRVTGTIVSFPCSDRSLSLELRAWEQKICLWSMTNSFLTPVSFNTVNKHNHFILLLVVS